MDYNIETHIHNFAVWTSARAIQRGFTTTSNIAKAIEEIELSNRIKEVSKDPTTYDDWHRNTCNDLIQAFKNLNIECSYGRGAKLLAIYIKTAVIIPDGGTSELSKVAHPPIDRILLNGLHKKNKALQLSKEAWTKWEEEDYFPVLRKLRSFKVDYFWQLEMYWKSY